MKLTVAEPVTVTVCVVSLALDETIETLRQTLKVATPPVALVPLMSALPAAAIA